jgi:light-independent protochlorophyllide reductase subunit B
MRLAYWMYEGTAHHGVGRVMNSMRNVHAVFHAPQGDDYVNTIFSMLERSSSFPAMTTSVVSGTDLAKGTIRLPETLRQVEAKLHPELIVVVASCSTILLQENLEIAAASAGIDAEVIVYDANPYRMQELSAAEGLFTELVKRYAAPQPLTERPSVNILGPASLGFHAKHDLVSLRRMLGTLGIAVNVVAPWGATPADLRRLPAAWLNIAPYRELGAKAVDYLEEQFGTPALREAPIGVQPTLRWLNQLIDTLNLVRTQRAASEGHASTIPSLRLPPLTAFSLDGMSAPSAVPWFARTADMESFSGKRAFVFGDATHTVGMAKFLRDELGMILCGAGTYMLREAKWVREQLEGYVTDEQFLATDEFQVTAARIAELQPDLICGTQMERHTARKHDLNCMVIAPPTHIENHLLAYRPFLGFDGADTIADEVYMTCTLGMEKHLIDLFGDAGLEQDDTVTAWQGDMGTEPQPQPSALSPQPSALSPQPSIVTWSPDAEAMLKKVPFFVRGRVKKNVEQYASEHGISEISATVLLEAKEAIGA